jgi:hypothetical protein
MIRHAFSVFLSLVLLFAVVLFSTACNKASSVDSKRSGASAAKVDATPLLPDTTSLLARQDNTTDEYAMVVARYGKPDSLLSTEQHSPKPKVPLSF